MAIIFENIDTGESILIDRATGGAFYRAKLSAAMNSSNMSPNADRGQDYGWRLQPEQQAIIEEWESDPTMIEKVADKSKVMEDALTHAEFLSYLLYQQELGKSPEQTQDAERRSKQAEYEARVAALREASRPVAAKPFVVPSKFPENDEEPITENIQLSEEPKSPTPKTPKAKK